MNPREALTYPDAVTRAAGLITTDGVAEAVNRSPSMVRKWMNPDEDYDPSISQCEAIDGALVEAGHPPVILPVYAARVTRHGIPHTRMDVTDRFLSIAEQCGNLSGEIRAAIDPQGPEGSGITPNESGAISGFAQELIDELHRLIRDLEREPAKKHEPAKV